MTTTIGINKRDDFGQHISVAVTSKGNSPGVFVWTHNLNDDKATHILLTVEDARKVAEAILELTQEVTATA